MLHVLYMSMRDKAYYSVRTGKNPLTKGFGLNQLRTLFHNVFSKFDDEGYFQESLGYFCVDADHVPGTLGHNLEGVLLLKLRKDNLAPIHVKIAGYSEDDLFDVIEFLYEHCSKPVDGYFHSYANCGMHYHTFDRMPGRQEFREKVNEILSVYEGGFELSSNGEILHIAETGMEGLFEAALPTTDSNNISSRVDAARIKFRRHGASLDDRRDAIRELADVLEYLRPELKTVLTKGDELDLFNIANNFGIRHHNKNQKTDYDRPIWYNWMFYYYLASIHAALRLIEKKQVGEDAHRAK